MDDHPIRAYRRLLLDLLAAGDDEGKILAVKVELPAVYAAHRFHYGSDYRMRQEIEARLLAGESFQEIASKLCADPKAIEYYNQIFFDVCDALDHSDWVTLTIRGRTRYDEASGCTRADVERGYVMRLFGYCGGARVVDSLVNPLGETKVPENSEEIHAWAVAAVTQIVQTAGTAAAVTIELTDKNKMRFIRLARRLADMRKTESGPSDVVINKHIQAALEWFKK